MTYALTEAPAKKPPKPKVPKHVCGDTLTKLDDGRYFCPRCLQSGYLMPNA